MAIIRVAGGTTKISKRTVIVYLVSQDKINWKPVPREEIPAWVLDEALTDQMLAGACLRNVLEEAERKELRFFTASYAEDLKLAPSRLRVAIGNLVVPNRSMH